METTTMRHLRLAAASGDAAAQFNLGVLFDSREDDNGYAIESNRGQAIKWLLAAAEQACRALRAGSSNFMRAGRKHQETWLTPVPGLCSRQKIRAAFTDTRLGRSTNGSPPG